MTYRQATVWICNYCNHNEYNDGDFIPSGWITLRISNDRIALDGTRDYHLCHNCVRKDFESFLEFLIENY